MRNKIIVTALIAAFATPFAVAQSTSALPTMSLGQGNTMSSYGLQNYPNNGHQMPSGLNEAERQRWIENERMRLQEKKREEMKRALPTFVTNQPQSGTAQANSGTSVQAGTSTQSAPITVPRRDGSWLPPTDQENREAHRVVDPIRPGTSINNNVMPSVRAVDPIRPGTTTTGTNVMPPVRAVDPIRPGTTTTGTNVMPPVRAVDPIRPGFVNENGTAAQRDAWLKSQQNTNQIGHHTNGFVNEYGTSAQRALTQGQSNNQQGLIQIENRLQQQQSQYEQTRAKLKTEISHTSGSQQQVLTKQLNKLDEQYQDRARQIQKIETQIQRQEHQAPSNFFVSQGNNSSGPQSNTSQYQSQAGLYERQRETLKSELSHATNPEMQQRLSQQISQLDQQHDASRINQANVSVLGSTAAQALFTPQVQQPSRGVPQEPTRGQIQIVPVSSVFTGNVGQTQQPTRGVPQEPTRGQIQIVPVSSVFTGNVGQTQQPTRGVSQEPTRGQIQIVPVSSVFTGNVGQTQQPTRSQTQVMPVSSISMSPDQLYNQRRDTLKMELSRATEPSTKQMLEKEIAQLDQQYQEQLAKRHYEQSKAAGSSTALTSMIQ